MMSYILSAAAMAVVTAEIAPRIPVVRQFFQHGRHAAPRVGRDRRWFTAREATTIELYRQWNAPVNLLRSVYDMATARPTRTSRHAALLVLCALNDTLTATVQATRYDPAGRYVAGGAR
jgi:hypothetical protein